MRDYIILGSTPIAENCVQVSNTHEYLDSMKAECKRFKAGLEKKFQPPDGAFLKIKSFPHDFGSYLEVVVMFDDNNEEATTYAYDLESDTPETWAELESI